MKRTRVEVQGTMLYYQEDGEGPPVVLVHGWTLDHAYWDLQFPALSPGYRTIAYSWRGCGASQGGEEPYPFGELVAELGIFLDAVVGDEPPVLVGHSLGGAIVLQYAVENAARLRALVVADIGLATPLARIHEEIEVHGIAAMVALAGLPATAPTACAAMWSRAFREANAPLLAVWEAQYQGNRVNPLLNSHEAWFNRPNLKADLGRITVPTLLIRGEEDALISAQEMALLAAGIPGAALQTLAGAGHMCFLEDPGTFNSLLAGFLAENVP